MHILKQQRLPSRIRKEQIKKALLEIIFTEGLNRVSTSNLAKKVGISEGTIFRHFRNKKEILKSILDDVQENLIIELKRIALMERPPEIRLERFLCYHMNYILDNRGITLLLFSEIAHMNDPGLKKGLYLILEQMKASLLKIIGDGMQTGIWDTSVSKDDITALYFGIPMILNIEMILGEGMDEEKSFCKRMLTLLRKVLEN